MLRGQGSARIVPYVSLLLSDKKREVQFHFFSAGIGVPVRRIMSLRQDTRAIIGEKDVVI